MNTGLSIECITGTRAESLVKDKLKADPSAAKLKFLSDYDKSVDLDYSTRSSVYQGVIWGLFVTTIPSGLIVDFYCPVKALQMITLIMIISNFFTPFVIITFGPWTIMILSFLRAVISGIFNPVIAKLISQWIPNNEKSTAITISLSGLHFMYLGMPFLTGLCSMGIHWSSVHFSSCGLLFIWLLLWVYFVKGNMTKYKNMDERERQYLESCPELKNSNKKFQFRIPLLKTMFTSPAFVSLFVTSVGTSIINAILRVFIPIYLPFFRKNTIYGTISILIDLFSGIGWAVMIDNYKSKGLCPTVAVKISQGIANIGSAVFLILVYYFTIVDYYPREFQEWKEYINHKETAHNYIEKIYFMIILTVAIPSGLLADSWSPVKLLQNVGIVMSFASMLIPIATNFGPLPLFGLVALICTVPSILFPAVYRMISRWIPNEEKSTAISIYVSGIDILPVFAYAILYFFHLDKNKWLSPCFASALLIFWLLLWRYTVKDNPTKCNDISDSEAVYLGNFPELKYSRKNKPYKVLPLKTMIKSPTVLSILVCAVGYMMAHILYLSYSIIFSVHISQKYGSTSLFGRKFYAFLLPLLQISFTIGWGIKMDHLKSKGFSNTTTVKISQAIFCFGSAIALVIFNYFVFIDEYGIFIEDFNLELTAVCLLGICISIAPSGYLTSMASIAPSYTGFIASIVFIFENIGRHLSFFILYIGEWDVLNEWYHFLNNCVSLILVFGGIVFIIYGSGEIQDWGITEEDKEESQQDQITIVESNIFSNIVTHV